MEIEPKNEKRRKIDAPPNSLKDSNASLKWKQWKNELGYVP
jgi:hypothetical protein